MSLGTALATGLGVVLVVAVAAVTQERLRRHAGRGTAFSMSGRSSDSSGSGFDAGGCDGGGDAS